jgi:hypothetical protein
MVEQGSNIGCLQGILCSATLCGGSRFFFFRVQSFDIDEKHKNIKSLHMVCLLGRHKYYCGCSEGVGNLPTFAYKPNVLLTPDFMRANRYIIMFNESTKANIGRKLLLW